jgi:hypothetical protein
MTCEKMNPHYPEIGPPFHLPPSTEMASTYESRNGIVSNWVKYLPFIVNMFYNRGNNNDGINRADGLLPKGKFT